MPEGCGQRVGVDEEEQAESAAGYMLFLPVKQIILQVTIQRRQRECDCQPETKSYKNESIPCVKPCLQ